MCVKCGASFSGAASDAAFGTGPDSPPPPAAPSGNSPKTVITAIVVSIAIVAAAIVAVTAVGSKHTASAPTTTFPSTWDPRVISLVQFDAKERGLDYLHPVKVVFLSDATFRKRLTAEATGMSAKDKREVQAELEALRAMGMVQGKVDLFQKLVQLSSETVEAYYDNEKKEVVIPGNTIDLSERVTLAHELTHTLDDEHFDLDKVQKIGDQHDTDAVEALVEGDAVAVQNDYVAKLSPSDRDDYERSQGQESASVDLKGIPKVLGVMQEWPYDVGPVFVGILRKLGGQARVNAAFRSPPIDEEQVIDPITYLDDDRPAAISTPAVPKGATKLDTGKEFGVMQWYLMLSEHIDAHVAMRAALGWGADAYTISRKGTQTCVDVHYRGETTRDNSQMLGALHQWIHALPKGMATVKANADNTLLMHSCDPGAAAKVVTDRSLGAYDLLLFRTSLIGELIAEKIAPAAATCVADGVTDHTSIAEANSSNGPAFARNAAAMLQLVGSCRSTLSTIVPPDEIDKG
jgi:hypothetical protein